MRPLELLAPAKNLECGIAAIDHGADAVYIGPERFGARAAAGNSIDDIRQLCQYAHQYAVKVYATVNTLIYDDERADVERLLWQLYEAGVDAVLIQDMSILKMKLPPIALHASTQADNRTAETVRLQYERGMRRVVLARELSVDEIAAIHASVPEVELEVFVHGALCVSYSGCCYASEYCFGRSANRGDCAQFCRMAFDLLDADGQVLAHDRYLLSLKDLNQIDHLQKLVEAGAVSFKIEGRLKNMAYVKNVTAAYSERLNAIIRQHPDTYCRASLGHCTYTFRPDLNRTFNRGFTHYFLNGRQPDIFSPNTPKAMGEYVGTVKELRGNSFTVAGTARFANGDGLCYINNNVRAQALEGFRVNRAECNRLFPYTTHRSLRPGMALYRNEDVEFERLLSRKSSERKIPLTLSLEATPTGFSLTADVLRLTTDDASSVTATIDCEHQLAEKPQRDNIVRQLTKLGGTPYECAELRLSDDFNFFIPSSLLAELRRTLVERLLSVQLHGRKGNVPTVGTFHSHGGNVSFPRWERFGSTMGPKPLMQCRHCLRYALGYCTKEHRKAPWREPLSLRLGDGRCFRLEFDCKTCQMNVYA